MPVIEVQTSRRPPTRLLLCVLLFGCGWNSAFAAEPRRELWQLVGKDVGLAVEVQGLAGETRKFIDSGLFQRIQRHSTWQQLLRGKEAQDLQNLQQAVQDVTRQPLVYWLEKLVGQEVLLGVTPQSGGRPRFVLLMRLAKPSDLPDVMAAWSQLEPRTATRLEHNGHEYFRRVKPGNPGEPLFHTLVDDVLVLSDQAEALTPVLDLAHDPDQRGSVRDEAGFQKIARTLHPASAIRIFVQPSAFERAAESAPAATDPAQRFIQHAWNHSQAMGIGVRQEAGLVAEVVVTSDDLARDPVWQKLVAKTSGAPAFLARVPRSAILAFAGRHNLGEISEWALSHTPADRLKRWKSVRQVLSGFLLGNDLLTEILPQLPADFGGYVVPRGDLHPTAAPVEGLLAVSLPAADLPGSGKPGQPPLRSSVDNALRTGISMLTALHNSTAKTEASIEEAEQQGVMIHWIDSVGPIQPAYAMAPDYFLVASSPQLIRDFLSQSPNDTWGNDSRLRKLREACFADASQVLALHGRLLGEFIGQRRELLLKQLETLHKLKPDEAALRLDRMLEWVQLSDMVVLAGSMHPDHVKLVLAIAVSEENLKGN